MKPLSRTQLRKEISDIEWHTNGCDGLGGCIDKCLHDRWVEKLLTLVWPQIEETRKLVQTLAGFSISVANLWSTKRVTSVARNDAMRDLRSLGMEGQDYLASVGEK